MPQIQIKRKGYFPISKAHIQIDKSAECFLWGGGKLSLDLPEGEHTVVIRMQGSTTTHLVKICSDSRAIVIKHSFPFILLALGLISSISFLLFPAMKILLAVQGILLIICVAISMHTIVTPNKNFKCTVESNE